MMKNLTISDKDRILIIAPHPDDETIGTGGLLLKYPGQCFVLVVTDGCQGDKMIAPTEMRRIRKQEFLDTMKFVGVNQYDFLEIPDGELINNPSCFDAIDFCVFSKIFIPNPNELHADHMATFRFAIKKIEQCCTNAVEIYCYETRSAVNDSTHVLDITDLIERKTKCCEFYRSQLKGFNYSRLVQSFADYHAAIDGKDGCYYEAYKKVNSDESGEDENIVKYIAGYRRKNAILERWLDCMLKNKSVALYCGERYGAIALYGFGYFGRKIYDDFVEHGIALEYVLDKKAEEFSEENVFYPSKKYSDVDVVIVSNMFDEDEIANDLEKIGYTHVITLWEILTDLVKKNDK
jgi:LmbE family N-acetylglucosaminyl deacetylase